METKIYISGAIYGLPFDEVKEKFDKAEDTLIAQGYEVVSPIKNFLPYDTLLVFNTTINILSLLGCDGVYLLSDWSYSESSSLEKDIAEISGKKLIYQETPVYMKLKSCICKVTGVTFGDIVNSVRKRESVYARMIYAYYRKKQGANISEISSEIKHKRGVVTYYLQKFEDETRYNPMFSELVNQVETAIKT